MALREEVPREFTDDVRWYRFFTQKMLVVFVTITFLGFLLCKLLSLFHLQIVGIFLTVIADAVAMVLIRVPMPSGNILSGSGLLIGDYLIRCRHIKKRKQIIYIKGYKEDTEHADDH